MKQILILKILLALFIIPCLGQKANPNFVDAKNREAIQITNQDKTQIVKSILLDFDYFNNPFRIDDREVIHLSTKNIPSNFVSKFFRITFVLLNPQEIEEKVKTGFRYYAFEEFKVVGSRVLISFSHIYRDSGFQTRWGSAGSPNSTNGILYEYRKFSGNWYGRRVSGYSSGS